MPRGTPVLAILKDVVPLKTRNSSTSKCPAPVSSNVIARVLSPSNEKPG
jgi:hypothetical protein